MCKEVYDKNENLLGYSILDLFIPKEMLIFLTEETDKFTDGMYGISKGNSIFNESGRAYYNVCELLTESKATLVFDIFKRANVKLNPFLFVKTDSNMNYKVQNLSSIWGSLFALKNCYCYTILDSNCNTLGFLSLHKNVYEEDEKYIQMFEVVEKGKGYGTKIMNYLLKFYNLSGLSTYSSVNFWKSLGASIDKSGHFILRRKKLDEGE